MDKNSCILIYMCCVVVEVVFGGL